jgi:1-acyl-sn-glycerol-3-phosphate acyltransferase
VLRTVLRGLLGGILRLFFRRIEVIGLERVPASGPVMFAMNHPNGLVDPLFPLCFAPRPVAFLAKAPLFSMPVVGWFVRTLDTIPVYRRQDPGSDPSRNRETFARARALLERGAAIAIAPEGTSHSDARLKPLRTGAARIALGAGTKQPVALVPVGLFYTAKATFRSAALVYFGPPVSVTPAPLDDQGEPPVDRVAAVTEALDAALAAVVVQADEHAALALAERTERLLGTAGPGHLAEAVELRRRLLAGYRVLSHEAPEALDRLTRRIERLEATFQRVGVDPAHLEPRHFRPTAILQGGLGFLTRLVVFLPLALPGALLHFPAYQLVGRLARRYAGDQDDVLATAKILGAAVLFPLTWLAVGIAVGWRWGATIGLGAALLAPLGGYAALRVLERFDRFWSSARALGLYLTEPRAFDRLTAARDGLRAELTALADRLQI